MYSDLYDLIDCLSRGVRVHIGVLFFGRWGNEKTVLPQKHKIHDAPVCTAMKATVAGYEVCYANRNAIVRRALEIKKPFHTTCPNGLLEYIHPVLMGEEVAALVFVGNACPVGGEATLAERLAADPALFDTVAVDFDLEACVRYAKLIESYIRVLLDTYASSANDPLIENIKNYVAENADYSVDLATLAAVFHYNEKYLGRLFKRQTGESFSAYINRQRAARAASLLLKSGNTVAGIVAKTGFSSVNYFNRVFKSLYGVTPTAYREGWHKGAESFDAEVVISARHGV